jgi:nicotinamidase/pyrazinamidase
MPDLIFWDVDTQFDFMNPRGKLCVPGAETIVSTLACLTAWAQAENVLIIASTDAHQPGDPEFREYPPHCLAGTPGQWKIPQTQLRNRYVVPNRPIKLPPRLNVYDQIVIEKQEFDVFSNPNIDSLLTKLGDAEIVLYGVVTEICVAAAARGLLDRGYRVSVLLNATYALDRAKADAALDEIEERGGLLLRTAELLGTAA